MPHRSEKYARQAIAASGLTILDPRIAFELRPDLWASAQDCRITFRRAQKFEGTHRVTATIEDYGDVLVCTRSLDALKQRIQWIAGRRVLAVKPAEADAVPPLRPLNYTGRPNRRRSSAWPSWRSSPPRSRLRMTATPAAKSWPPALN